MKRLLALFTVAAFLLAVPASHHIWSKAHVPLKKAQVCHKGTTLVVSENAVQGHVRGHGDCQIPVCDNTVVRLAGADCSSLVDNDGDGKCDLASPNPVVNPPRCPAGKF